MRITESQLRRIVKRLISEQVSDDEINNVVRYYTSNPQDWNIAREHFSMWASNLNARVPGVNREMKYPGWTKGDFRYVLERLG